MHCNQQVIIIVIWSLTDWYISFTFPPSEQSAVLLLKKPSLDKESLSMFRPIFNLSFFFKFTELVVKESILLLLINQVYLYLTIPLSLRN